MCSLWAGFFFVLLLLFFVLFCGCIPHENYTHSTQPINKCCARDETRPQTKENTHQPTAIAAATAAATAHINIKTEAWHVIVHTVHTIQTNTHARAAAYVRLFGYIPICISCGMEPRCLPAVRPRQILSFCEPAQRQ